MKDAQKAALNELGYTGSNQDMENKFFFDALGKKLPNSQGLYEWLSSLGYSSYSLQDRLNMYLRGLGYSGSINDMLKKAFKEKTFYNAMKSILNKYFPNAHMYLPGVGTVQGFTAGNYVESTGVTPATVDQPVGLVLDAAGSVVAELVTNIATHNANSAISSSTVPSVVSCVSNGTFGCRKDGIIAANKSYAVTVTWSGNNEGRALYLDIGNTTQSLGASEAGTRSFVASPTVLGAAIFYALSGVIGNDFTVSVLTVREITGIHASQATSGFRPVERRGIVNLLLNNKWDGGGTAPTGWTAFGAGGAQGSVLPNGCYTRTFAPVASRDFINTNFTTLPNTTYTVVFYVEANSGLLANELIGSGTIPAGATFAISGTTAPTGSYLFATLTVGATGGTFTLRCGAGCSGPVTGSVTLSQPAIFQGTLTASQIIAMGGIPLTTTAAASSAMGPYYLQFDGTDDRLTLGSVPFQMTDDHCVVVAASVGSLSANRILYSQRNTGNTFPIVAQISIETTGRVLAYYRNTENSAEVGPASAINIVQPNSIVVITLRKVGTALVIRVNGTVVSTATAPTTGTFDINAAAIGASAQNGTLPHSGNIYACIPIKGTLTDAEITLLENHAAQLAGVTL